MSCKTCPYFVESNNGYAYCAYFCEEIDRVIALSMCKWLEEIYENSKSLYDSRANRNKQ